MSLSEKVNLITKGLGFVFPYACSLFYQRIAAIFHRWTWHDTADAKNVVVIGGSFAGFELVNRLSHSLPTGYKIIWIEKNSHLNYSFNFPRYSVMSGHEYKAFIPYDGAATGAPAGIFTRIQDRVVEATASEVLLASGQKVPYTYLAIATGSTQPLPVQVSATEREHACRELRTIQRLIKSSQKVAIVGGGAVGVELAGDIKDFYPDKDVTLVHSRGEVLSQFGKRLQDHALEVLRDELNVRVLLNERPKLPAIKTIPQPGTLTFSDKHEEYFDLIIGCTGQQPNSALLTTLLPDSISDTTLRITVAPTLQVAPKNGLNDVNTPIFAFGDVAEHGGPRMARAAWFQAGVVHKNIMALIHGNQPGRTYQPNSFIEGAIKLTLGKTRSVIYSTDEKGKDVMFPSRSQALDLEVEKAWSMFGADIKTQCSPVM